jgi:hypothetical protein
MLTSKGDWNSRGYACDDFLASSQEMTTRPRVDDDLSRSVFHLKS